MCVRHARICLELRTHTHTQLKRFLIFVHGLSSLEGFFGASIIRPYIPWARRRKHGGSIELKVVLWFNEVCTAR